MKSDINALMAKRDLDAIMILGGEGYAVVRDYLSNGAHITGGTIIKKQGHDPLLIVSGMEIEEAQKSGLPCKTTADLGYAKLLEDLKDPMKAHIAFLGKCLEAADVHEGKIGLYGEGAINVYIELVIMLRDTFPQYEFVGETGVTLFDEAMLTKDTDELARIESVAARTNEVLQETWDFVGGHSEKDGTLMKSDGTPLLIGEVRAFVRMELLRRGLEDTGMIFAQGRDAGFPHSRGEDDMALQTGQSIVFDLFPREIGGGYHHDVTRTWSIGYATPEVQDVYDQVMRAFDIAVEQYGLEKPTHLMQEAVQDAFEANDHPTSRSQPGTQVGYVHSLGHGVGLQIHERPSISHLRKKDIFEKGNFITIEPGLYYPEKGLGVRVEDSFIITDSGELRSITPFRKDLVLPLNGDA
ncbi:MAG: M24 family metallopeptidase [Aggregatilineales bacterium]